MPQTSTDGRGTSVIRREGLLGLLGLLGVGLAQEVLPRSGLVDPNYLPTAGQMLTDLLKLFGERDFWVATGLTLRGWLLGLTLATVGGVLVGAVIGSVAVLREFTASTVEFLRPIPSVALIPLVVLLFGSRPESALTLVGYAATWQVLIQVLYGVADVDPVARDTARSYRFSRLTVARTVVWPTALPYVLTGFRLAAAVALILEITAELVIGVPGLGRSIGVAQASGAVGRTYALVVFVGLVGVTVNVAARALERRLMPWHPAVRRENVG